MGNRLKQQAKRKKKLQSREKRAAIRDRAANARRRSLRRAPEIPEASPAAYAAQLELYRKLPEQERAAFFEKLANDPAVTYHPDWFFAELLDEVLASSPDEEFKAQLRIDNRPKIVKLVRDAGLTETASLLKSALDAGGGWDFLDIPRASLKAHKEQLALYRAVPPSERPAFLEALADSVDEKYNFEEFFEALLAEVAEQTTDASLLEAIESIDLHHYEIVDAVAEGGFKESAALLWPVLDVLGYPTTHAAHRSPGAPSSL